MNRDSPFRWRRRVGMRDVDAWNVVWYGNYFVFCDEARAELLRAFDLVPGTFLARGFVMPVVEVRCNYRAPARFDEELLVDVHVHKPRGTRLRFDFQIRRSTDGTLLAEVSTEQVLVNTNGELIYLIPADIGACIERMLQAQDARAHKD